MKGFDNIWSDTDFGPLKKAGRSRSCSSRLPYFNVIFDVVMFISSKQPRALHVCGGDSTDEAAQISPQSHEHAFEKQCVHLARVMSDFHHFRPLFSVFDDFQGRVLQIRSFEGAFIDSVFWVAKYFLCKIAVSVLALAYTHLKATQHNSNQTVRELIEWKCMLSKGETFPPVLVPPIISKISQGSGGVARFCSLWRRVINCSRISSADSPRTPPPSAAMSAIAELFHRDKFGQSSPTEGQEPQSSLTGSGFASLAARGARTPSRKDIWYAQRLGPRY